MVSVIIGAQHKSRIKQKTKQKIGIKNKHKSKVGKFVKILKKYKFQQDGAAPPADGAAPPADPPADASAADAPADSKGEKALASTGVTLTEEQKVILQQRESLQKSSDIKKMVRQFKTLAEPSKIFTEGEMDLDKPHLILENSDSIPEDYDKMESTKECEYKEGYLAFITEIRLPQYAKIKGSKDTSKYPVMTGIAVLAVLNKNSLSLFDKEHVNSLLRTFDIMHLSPVVYKNNFGDLQCFQLISVVNSENVALTQSPDSTYVDPSKVMATLCCSSFNKLYDWKDAIEKFSHCKVEVAQDETEKVANTFDTIKNRVKTLRERIKDDEKVNQEYSKTNNAQELLMVQKYVENMKKAVADEVNKQNQDKRELTVKLENDIKKSVGTTQQEECLEKALQIQQDEESRAVEGMIQSESETREEEELKKQQEDMIKQLKEKGKNIALQEDSLDQTIQKMTKQMQYNMVQSVEQFERITSPDMCDFSKDVFPKGVVTVDDRTNYVCTQMIDPQAVDIETVNDCMVSEYFCDVCCNYNIGPADEMGRENCVQECRSNYSDGPANKFELIYVLEVNTERLKNFLVKQMTGSKLEKLKKFLQQMADANTTGNLKKATVARQFEVTEQETEKVAKEIKVNGQPLTLK